MVKSRKAEPTASVAISKLRTIFGMLNGTTLNLLWIEVMALLT